MTKLVKYIHKERGDIIQRPDFDFFPKELLKQGYVPYTEPLIKKEPEKEVAKQTEKEQDITITEPKKRGRKTKN